MKQFHNDIKGSVANRYLLLFIYIAVFVGCTGFGYFLYHKRITFEDKKRELAAIADLKAGQISQWRKERLTEAASIHTNAMMSHRITDYLSGRDKEAALAEFKNWMTALHDKANYNRLALFKTDGTLIASVPDFEQAPSGHYLAMITEASNSQKIIFSDFHRDELDGDIDIDLSIPISHVTSGQSSCSAVLVLETNPHSFLYPLIKNWPLQSRSAETLLVKRDGNDVLFLNELRHRQNTALTLRTPLTNKEMPSVRAVLGEEGVFEGVDYRGATVLAATRTIPDSPWAIVAKTDTSEIYEPITKRAMFVMVLGILVIISAGLTLFLWWVKEREKYLRVQYEKEVSYNVELAKAKEAATQSRDYHLKLFENFPAMIWRAATDGQCDYFNHTWLEFTGRSLDQELGDRWSEGVYPDDLATCLTTYRAAFAARRPFVMEYRLRNIDGTYHWIHDHGRPYEDLEGNFAGFIGSCYDINTQKIAEQALIYTQEALEQRVIDRTMELNRINAQLRNEISERKQLEQQLISAKKLELVGQLAGGVAHEVRNPLNAILSITEALFREKEIEGNPEFHPYIGHIREQVNRLAHLMNDLLDLGKGIPESSLQPVDLNSLCSNTVILWQSTGSARSKSALFITDENCPNIKVLADSMKLQQVFFNLLENAAQHSPVGSKIQLRLSCSGGNMALVRIVDHGKGIPEDKIERVFDPFFTDRKGGTGLGLALVRHFMEHMHGSVTIANNNPPPGCTAEVRIPLAGKVGV
jgi:PAS domain S-box-containing protein